MSKQLNRIAHGWTTDPSYHFITRRDAEKFINDIEIGLRDAHRIAWSEIQENPPQPNEGYPVRDMPDERDFKMSDEMRYLCWRPGTERIIRY